MLLHVINIIKETKKINYNSRILKSSNKNKTTWDIKKLETGKNFSNGDIPVLDIEGKPSYSQQATADAFNNYFLSFTKNKTYNNTGTNQDITSTPLYILSQISKNAFTVKGV